MLSKAAEALNVPMTAISAATSVTFVVRIIFSGFVLNGMG